MCNNGNIQAENGASENGAEQSGKTKEVAVRNVNGAAAPGFESGDSFDTLQRITNMFAYTANILPKEFRGRDNYGNCAIALEMAFRLGMPPLAVFQNLFVVNGKPSWSSAFMVACLNKTGRFSTLRYVFSGTPGSDDWGCKAVARDVATGETLEGTSITLGMAKAEGWFGKPGSKWKTMPEQMMRYRAASFFIRAYAPEIAMGLHSEDELRDSMPEPAVAYAAPQSSSAQELNAALATAEPKKRGRRAATRKALEEPAEAAVIDVTPAPEPETVPVSEPEPEPEVAAVAEPQPEPEPAAAYDSKPSHMDVFMSKCRSRGLNINAVRTACMRRYPSLNPNVIHEMLATHDAVFEQAVRDSGAF